MNSNGEPMAIAPLIEARGLDVWAPGGRQLFSDLWLQLGRDRVALVGRNGVGKSTLLRVLCGHEQGDDSVVRRGETRLVAQHLNPADVAAAASRHEGKGCFVAALREVGLESVGLESASRLSGGELRKLALVTTKLDDPDFLFLDEPTQELDETGTAWLRDWLGSMAGGVLVASHDRQLLSDFRHFFVVEESGARLFVGKLEDFERDLETRRQEQQRQYVRSLVRLEGGERKSARTAARRRRKKNLGRLHEIRRAPSRAKLNENRSYAQESQGKRGKLRRARLETLREWTRLSRRALSVSLPLRLALPELPADDGGDNVLACDLSLRVGQRQLVRSLSFALARGRLGVVGPNGCGKTTLLRTLIGERDADGGTVSRRTDRIGAISQGALDWCSRESLLDRLLDCRPDSSPSDLAKLVVAHRFPFALAERPLQSLSPGERVRAALIGLFFRRSPIELLLVDEPTANLDFLGSGSLVETLRLWPGGLIVSSHDRAFLRAVGVSTLLELDGRGGHRLVL